jgi:hypothetical protein
MESSERDGFPYHLDQQSLIFIGAYTDIAGRLQYGNSHQNAIRIIGTFG